MGKEKLLKKEDLIIIGDLFILAIFMDTFNMNPFVATGIFIGGIISTRLIEKIRKPKTKPNTDKKYDEFGFNIDFLDEPVVHHIQKDSPKGTPENEKPDLP